MSTMLAIGGAVVVVVLWCLLAAVSGVLGDELKGWIAWATRRLVERAAARTTDPDHARDLRADFEAALQSPDHRPIWLLCQSTFVYRASARTQRGNTRFPAVAFFLRAILGLNLFVLVFYLGFVRGLLVLAALTIIYAWGAILRELSKPPRRQRP